MTVDLPSAWVEADLDHDGQIGLYEWDRAKYAEFFALDANRDGLLTPQEIARSGAATPSAAARTPNAAPVTGAQVTAASPPGTPALQSGSSPGRAATAAVPSSAGSATAPADRDGSSGPITAVEFDPDSQEGRWARFVFGRLDRDRDGTISQDEWSRSRSTRMSFEKRNVQIRFPASFEQFGGLIVAVQRAEKGR